MHLQNLILELQNFWADKGCIIQQPIDLEVGAGTFNPATFLRALGPEPFSTAFVQPCRRPTDGRYAENPNRVGAYYQFQIGLKPSPPNSQDLYLSMLDHIGLSPKQHDIRFVEDDWESPTLGAWGLGWEVWADGMEITQFTYFQQCGGIELSPVTVELTLGLERLAMYLQNVDNIFDLKWNDHLTYGDIHRQSEIEFSKFNFESADTELGVKLFDQYEQESHSLIKQKLALPAYDFCMKASHAFNVLDARGAISVTERQNYIGRVRKLARQCAEAYVTTRAELGFPLLEEAKGKKASETFFAQLDSGVSAAARAASRSVAE